MSRYGKFDDFCRDTGNVGSTLPGTLKTLVIEPVLRSAPTNRPQSATYVVIPPPLAGLPSVTATLTVILCLQLFNQAPTRQGTGWEGGCELTGFSVGGGDRLRNLGEQTWCCAH
jgi:hypothetical protein